MPVDTKGNAALGESHPTTLVGREAGNAAWDRADGRSG